MRDVVSELIEIAGGEPCCKALSKYPDGKRRIIEDPQFIIDANPDIILGSWCGRKFRPEQVAARDGWNQITAVRNNDLYEIKSPLILQPGPAALTEGLDALHDIFARWNEQQR